MKAAPLLAGTLLALLAGCAPGHATAPATLGDRAACGRYSGLPAQWGQSAQAGMLRIEAGTFQLGGDRGYAEERPLRETRVDAFWIDRTEVTNAQFGSFVEATGYVTEAERGGGAAVFRTPDALPALDPRIWWRLDTKADWRHPDGSASSIRGRGNEPVVDVSYNDALAYAKWLGHALPTEAQWEFAAKAGRSNEAADASLRDEQGRPRANFWQGMFPLKDTAEDGLAGRAPVGCFAANPDGLHDMVGNVWEWTRDPYAGGPDALGDPMPAGRGAPRQVIKGGSYLCSLDYCARARAASRQGQEADLPASHIGFRTVSD